MTRRLFSTSSTFLRRRRRRRPGLCLYLSRVTRHLHRLSTDVVADLRLRPCPAAALGRRRSIRVPVRSLSLARDAAHLAIDQLPVALAGRDVVPRSFSNQSRCVLAPHEPLAARRPDNCIYEQPPSRSLARAAGWADQRPAALRGARGGWVGEKQVNVELYAKALPATPRRATVTSQQP